MFDLLTLVATQSNYDNHLLFGYQPGPKSSAKTVQETLYPVCIHTFNIGAFLQI